MHNSRIKRVAVAVCLALMPVAASAAGLGKLTILSSLGQPLDAEIELSATKEELASLNARIAPSNVYAEQGVERASILSTLNIAVSQRADGRPVLKLSSAQTVNDPFLDMLVQVEWSSGSLMREYTALLDPPGFGDQPVATSSSEPTAAPATSAPTSEAVADTPAATAKPIAKAKRQKAAAVTEKPQTNAPATEHVVKTGDTLGGIANKMQAPEGVSLDQMLVGLYKANPDAFVGNNMNRLKVGQIVRQPSAEELQAISQQEAAQEIRVQSADWNSYRSKLASAVAEAPAAKEEAPRQGASGKITAPAEDKGAAQPGGPRDVVKLSKGDTSAGKPDKTQAGASAAQEDITAREKSVKDANERIAALEKQVQELKQLLELKNQSLADLQKNATARAEATKPAEAAKPAEKPAETKPAETKPVEAAPAPVQDAPTATPITAETKPEPKPEAKPEETQPKHKKKIVPPPPPPEETLTDVVLKIVQENLPLIGALLLAIGAGGWLAQRRKGGKKSAADQEAAAVSPVNASIMEDFQKAQSEAMIDNNDVDPISVAEGYLSYGRDAQAEEVLKEAIAKEPQRVELQTKLLEIYAERKDAAAFEQVADKLYGDLGSDAPELKKVAELGRRLLPDNPRYAEEPQTVASQAEPADLELPADTTLDFSLDTPAAEPVADTENTLDFDVPAADSDEVQVLEMPDAELDLPDLPPTEVATEPEPSLLESIDQLEQLPDLDMPELATENAAPAQSEVAVEENANLDFALDLPEPAASENAQLDAADLGLPELGTDMGLPELDVAEPVEDAVPESVPDLDFAAPELGDTEPAQVEATTDLDFAMPELNVPELAAVEETPAGELEMPAMETSGLDVVTEESSAVEEAEAALESLPELDDTIADGTLEDMSLELPDMPADAFPEDLGDEVAETAETSMPELVLPELEEPVIEEPVAEVSETTPELPEVSFDLPEIETPAADAVNDFAGMTVEETTPDAAGFDLDAAAPAMTEEPAPETAEEDSKELVVEEIAFDIPAEEEAPVAPAAEMDLSDIDLELGDAKPAAQLVQEIEDEITLTAPSEPADVDTKLDLVTAYLDMGDKEGARELLQEVLEEGGPKQKERAQKIMDTL